MSSFPAELTGNYTVDGDHSTIGFVARHAMVSKTRGKFSDYTVNFTLDADNPENSSATVTIQVDSVNTGSEQRDGHLRTNDFFDLENYPTIEFKTTSIKQTGDNSFDVTGNLQIKDVTKEITIPFTFEGPATDPWGGTRVGFEGAVNVNRKDWNITWNNALDGGGVLVGDKVRLEFELEGVKDA